MSISVLAGAGRIDYQTARGLSQCLRCEGKKRPGNVLCNDCYNIELQIELAGDNPGPVRTLLDQIHGMERPRIIQPMRVVQDLISVCGQCGWQVDRKKIEESGSGYFCPECKNSLVSSVAYQNARIGSVNAKGPKGGKYLFLTQKDLGPASWEKTQAPGKSHVANMRMKLDRARAEHGRIYAADGEIIAQIGSYARAVDVEPAKQNMYKALKLALRGQVERSFFARFTGVVVSEQVPAANSGNEANINCETAKIAVPTSVQDGRTLQ